MAYFKGILSGLAAIILAELVRGLWFAFRGINNSKATGLAALAGILLENLFSPLFWVLLSAAFALFFMASRSGDTALRVLFFWIPTLTVLSVAGAISGLITLLVIRARNP